MKIILIIVLFISINLSFSKDKSKVKSKQESFKPIKVDNKYSYKIINGLEGTYGYDILSNDKITIHQPSIPAIGGNLGFKEKKHAESVAKFVIYKLQNNVMPPSVTPSEIDSLKKIK